MPVAIEYKDVSFSYEPGSQSSPVESGSSKLVLDRIRLTVDEGEHLGILGPNGGGKSTLLKLTLGLLLPRSGSIRVLGMTPRDARRARVVGYVPQRSEAELAFPLSARQVVSMSATAGLAPWRSIDSDRRRAIDDAIETAGVAAFAEKPIGALSGGQVQRTMIARALACRPRILVLDEPMVGIDPAGQQQFSKMLAALHHKFGLTVVIVSHDIRTVAAGCDRIACLARTLHSHVTPKGLTPAVLAEVFRHDVAAIFGDVHVDAHPASSCSDPSHTHGNAGAVPAMMPTIQRIAEASSPTPSTSTSTTREDTTP
jgi:zinc transport system ATP-binding protein